MKKRTTVTQAGVTTVYEDGVLHAEIPSGDGIRKYFHPNGSVKEEIPVIAGEANGVVRGWHENGQRASEANYARGAIQGIAIFWNRDGSLSQTLNYINSDAIYGISYDDRCKARRLCLWNGKPIGRVRWLKKLEAAGMSVEEVQRRVEASERVPCGGASDVAGGA